MSNGYTHFATHIAGIYMYMYVEGVKQGGKYLYVNMFQYGGLFIRAYKDADLAIFLFLSFLSAWIDKTPSDKMFRPILKFYSLNTDTAKY